MTSRRILALLLLGLCAAAFLSSHAVVANESEEDLAGGDDDGEDVPEDVGDAKFTEEDDQDANEDDEDPSIDESAVVVLGDDNFNQTIADNKFVLVEFYAPWCGHCKSLKPEYAQAAAELKEADPPVVLAKVDATKHESLSGAHGVEGFPTLKWFVEGKSSEFGGGRTAGEIVAWCKKRSGKPTTAVESNDAVEAELKTSKVVVISFIEDKTTDLSKAFISAAMESNLPFLDGNAAVATARGGALGSIVLYKTFDEPSAVYSGDSTPEALLEFVAANSRPSVFDFSEDQVEAMFHNEIPKIALFTFDDSAKAAFDAAAQSADIKGKFIMMRVANDQDPNFFEYMGVSSEAKEPQLYGIDASSGKKYKFEGSFTTDAIQAFAKDFSDGKIKPHLKSAAVPETQEGDVVEVVGTTFDSIVKDPTKHVVIEFYAPWCGHCQKLAPLYEKAAAHFKSSNPDDVVIAKIDGTTNEIEDDLAIEGFPTMYAFPKDAKDAPVDLSQAPRKSAKTLINAFAKAFGIPSTASRPGEDKYRDAVARLKVALKAKPDMLEMVAGELDRVANMADAELKKAGLAKDEL